MSGFVRAERKRAFIKINLCGPEGSGKTMSALLVAQGLVGEGPQFTVPPGKVAVLDTENGSASLYSDLFAFDVQELGPPFRPERYISIIKEAAAAGYEVLIIDSTSHEWAGTGGILFDKEALDAKGGSSFTNWKPLSPRHDAFLDAILQAKIHIICTTRTKTEYVIGDGGSGGGKSGTPKKVGMAPIQREGFNYQFGIVFDVAERGDAFVNKDRTRQFDEITGKLTPEHGARIKAWLESGAAPDPDKERPVSPEVRLYQQFADACQQNGLMHRILGEGNRPSKARMKEFIANLLDAEPYGDEDAPTEEDVLAAIDALPSVAAASTAVPRPTTLASQGKTPTPKDAPPPPPPPPPPTSGNDPSEDDDPFGEDEPKPATAAAISPDGCAVCGAKMSKPQIIMSKNKFGRPLCLVHQKEATPKSTPEGGM
jgi:DNA polymerase III delta prime subunit